MMVQPRSTVLVLTAAILFVVAFWTSGCAGVAEPAPSLAVTPNALSVSAKIGNSSSEVVSVTNIGTNDVSLQQAILSGTNFSVSGLSTPATLTAGQSKSFNVKFSATTAGSINGSLAIMTDAQHRPVILSLHGNASSSNPPVASVAVTPTVVSLAPNSSATFSATVQGATSNAAVTWSASVGNITPSGVYTSPLGKAVGTVTATSVADPTKSASALVMVAGPPVGNPTPDPPTPPVSSVSITPSVTSVATGGKTSFAASVQGTASNKTVSWACSTGNITQSGVYSAPSTGGMAFVTATSVADPTKTATATVTVVAGPSSPQSPIVNSVTVSPATASAATGGSLSFTASVQGSTSNKSVTWKALLGVITASGQYTAPAKAGTDIVTATSVADSTKTGGATVTVTGGPTSPTGPAVTSVTVSPSTASSVTTGTLSFTASVQGSTSNKSVTWKALLGTITTGGQYTAPAKAGTDTVTAISVADASVSGSASVNVTAAPQPPVVTSVSVSPASTSVNTGGGAQFTASVQGTVSDKSVTWAAALGTISSSGAYTAPNKAGTDTVTATSNADSSKSASATVTVTAAPSNPTSGVSCSGSNCPAFPGAQGGGAESVGGRGGVVIEVTNTNDSGTGSLRACVEASGPRTCVFRVAGMFPITSADLRFTSPYLTIAGQTAPGEVILGGPKTNGALMGISTHDVIVRYVTFSPDNFNTVSGPDGGTTSIWIVNCPGNGSLDTGGCYNIIVDHVTTRWSGNKSWITTSNYTPLIHGNGDGDGPNHDITTQWSLDYEPHEGHPVGFGTATDESCVGTLAGPCLSPNEKNIDFHHDMLVNVGHRIPENSNFSTRWVNNIIYNWNYYANEWLGAESIDDINNKFITGNLNAGAQAHPIHFTTNSPEMSGNPSVYVSGNIFGPPGTNAVNSDQYGQLVAEITGENGDETGPIPGSWARSGPMAPSNAFPIVPDAATNLDSVLLGTVGNSQHLDCNGNWVSHRDPQDNRIINQYRNGGDGGFWPNGVTFSGVGLTSANFPGTDWQDAPVVNGTTCAESMHDGIPDAWKQAKGLSTTDPNLYKTVAPNGFTWLENYLSGQ
jgi:hypothetical protein